MYTFSFHWNAQILISGLKSNWQETITLANNDPIYPHVSCAARCDSQLAVRGVEWAECSLIIVEFKFLAWSSTAQSVCQWGFGLLAIWCRRPWVRILHSAEEDNLSPFDSNIACLCQSIEINNNKHIEGILPKGPYLPCVSMAGRALLAGYPRYIWVTWPRWLWHSDAICIELGQHWLTWTNVALSSVRSTDIHLREISHEISQPPITKIFWLENCLADLLMKM